MWLGESSKVDLGLAAGNQVNNRAKFLFRRLPYCRQSSSVDRVSPCAAAIRLATFFERFFRVADIKRDFEIKGYSENGLAKIFESQLKENDIGTISWAIKEFGVQKVKDDILRSIEKDKSEIIDIKDIFGV